jgi:Zn finger protein HypA/HybF involved in hydrogenase expression
MIDRQHGKVVIECDSCDEVFESNTGDFKDAWHDARSEGWRTRQIADEWLHGCPKCGVPT